MFILILYFSQWNIRSTRFHLQDLNEHILTLVLFFLLTILLHFNIYCAVKLVFLGLVAVGSHLALICSFFAATVELALVSWIFGVASYITTVPFVILLLRFFLQNGTSYFEATIDIRTGSYHAGISFLL